MSPLSVKLLRLALDPAAQPGEAESAAVAFIRRLRADGTRPEDLLGATDTTRASPRMPFGQYKGLTLASIAADDPDYLRWVLDTCTKLRPGLRKAIEAALEKVKP